MSWLDNFLEIFLDQNLDKFKTFIDQENLTPKLEKLLDDLVQNKQTVDSVYEKINYLLKAREQILSNLVNQDLNDVEITASLRAPQGYHIPEILTEISLKNPDYLVKFGGHPSAAGFTAKEKYLKNIQEEFTKLVEKQENSCKQTKNFLTKEEQQKLRKLSAEQYRELEKYLTQVQVLFISSQDLNINFLKQIQKLDPFGQDFPMPELLINLDLENKNQSLKSSLQWRYLSSKKHLKLTLNKIEITIFNLDPKIIEKIDSWLDSLELNFQTEQENTSPIYKKEKVETENSKKYQVLILAKIIQNTWQQKTKLELIANKLFIFEV